MPEVTIRVRPPARIERVWYRRLGLPAPEGTGSSGPRHADWVRLLPYGWRWLHHVYAVLVGFFWLPCPLCGRPFGGHESGDSVPNPTRPATYVAICSRCTITRATTDEGSRE